MIEHVIQAAVLGLTGGAAWAFGAHRFKLAFMLGLLGQPFWIYSAWVGNQWGIFLLSLWYLYHNVRGYRRCLREVDNAKKNVPQNPGGSAISAEAGAALTDTAAD